VVRKKRASDAPSVVRVIVEAPWCLVLGAWRALMAPLRLHRALRQLRRGLADELPCPAGHANRLVGRWECRCGYVYVGHVFAPCSSCGQVAGWFPCERCGLGVRSPAG